MRLTALLSVTALVGCTSMTEDEHEDVARRPDESFHRTVVVFDDSGEPIVSDEPVEPSGESGLRPRSVSSTSTCADADLQLWDRADFTGNTICFVGSGHADLAAYRLPPSKSCAGSIYCWLAPWSGRVRSYRMAPLPGTITSLAEPYAAIFTNGSCQECVKAGAQRAAGTCAQQANAIDIIGVGAYSWNPPAACGVRQ